MCVARPSVICEMSHESHLVIRLHGRVVKGVEHRQLVRFSFEYAFLSNFTIDLEYCHREEAVNYRPSALSLHVTSHVKNSHFCHILLLL